MSLTESSSASPDDDAEPVPFMTGAVARDWRSPLGVRTPPTPGPALPRPSPGLGAPGEVEGSARKGRGAGGGGLALSGPPGGEGGDAFTWQRQAPGAPVSYPGEETAPARSRARSGRSARGSRRGRQGCSAAPACPRVVCLASSCFRCGGRKLAGEGTFLPCNPELLPRHWERGPPGAPPCGGSLHPAIALSPRPRGLLPPSPRPAASPCGGRARDPRGCPQVCSGARSSTERAITPEESPTVQNVCTAGCLSRLCPGPVPLRRATSERSFST